MTIITTPPPVMSPAQHRALTRAAADPAGFVARVDGVSSSTILGLDAGHGWADVVWETVVKKTRGGKERTVNRIAGATITHKGRCDLLLVDGKRDQADRNAAVTRVGVAALAADPFAVVAAVNGPELVIPF